MFGINLNLNFPKLCHLILTGTDKHSEISKLDKQGKCLILECVHKQDGLKQCPVFSPFPATTLLFYSVLWTLGWL